MYLLMTDAVQTTSVYKIKDIEIILEVGQGAASDMELAEYSCYNHKTIGKLIDSFLTGSIYRSPEPTTGLSASPECDRFSRHAARLLIEVNHGCPVVLFGSATIGLFYN